MLEFDLGHVCIRCVAVVFALGRVANVPLALVPPLQRVSELLERLGFRCVDSIGIVGRALVLISPGSGALLSGRGVLLLGCLLANRPLVSLGRLVVALFLLHVVGVVLC